VGWENQNDNASGTGYRECFSSCCAIRAKYGDSTSAEAQLSALVLPGADRQLCDQW
jgi:hypothetical protein